MNTDNTPKIGDKRYRYDHFRWRPESPIELKCYEWFVKKVTPCGVWIAEYSWQKDPKSWKFVLETWSDMAPGGKVRKKFAHTNKAEALESYIHRKCHQIGHLRRQLRNAKEGLEVAQELQEKQKLETDNIQTKD